MIYSVFGPLPKHRYVWVQPNAIGEHDWIRAVWFGIVSLPSRAWGCNLLLECGAVYRNVPLHQIAAFENAEAGWAPDQAQKWDCYGTDFSILEYPYLREMTTIVGGGFEMTDKVGTYMFSVVPVGDGWSNAPEQAKEFIFCELSNGRFCAQPTNGVLFCDSSFTAPQWPTFLRRQTEVWSAEP